MWRGFGFFLVTYLMVTIVTLIRVPRATQNFEDHPWAWLIVLLNVAGLCFSLLFGDYCLLVCLFGFALSRTWSRRIPTRSII
jgi:hypothetical protein